MVTGSQVASHHEKISRKNTDFINLLLVNWRLTIGLYSDAAGSVLYFITSILVGVNFTGNVDN